MNREKEDKIHILTYSIALHSIALIALLLSLQETSLFNKKKPAEIIFAQQEEQKKQQLIPKEPDKKEEKTKTTPYDPTTFTVPIPVMYYGNEVDPNKKPGAPGIEQKEKGEVVPPPLIKEPEKNIPAPKNDQLAEEKTLDAQRDTIDSIEDSLIETIHTEPEKLIEVEDLSSGTFIPIIAEPPVHKHEFKKQKKSTTPQSSVKKALTLADLFKKPLVDHSNEPILIGEGSGQPVVIKEGDMRYYTVWTKFLQHLNQTAQFNRIKKNIPLINWVRSGLLKKDLYCGITVTKEGKVLAIDIISSSGYKPFDDTCVSDIWASSPFPPLPESMHKEQARFEVRSHI